MGKVRRWFYDHGVRWSGQNLTHNGSMWQEGRAWIRFFKGNGETGVGFADLLEIEPSWHFGKRKLEFALAAEIGSVWLFTFCVPYVRSYLRLEGALISSQRMLDQREISLRWHDGKLWWALWTDPEDPPIFTWKAPRWRFFVL